MQRFLALLKHTDLDLDAEAIADVLWLANQLNPGEVSEAVPSEPEPLVAIEQRTEDRQPLPPPPKLPDNPAQVAVKASQPRIQASGSALPFQAPAAPALRNALELGRSLRPLMRKVPSRTEQILDEEATAIQIAESAGRRQWVPVFQAAPERWLDLALVVEESRSTVIWQELITEFQALLERQGAFRHIHTWSLRADTSGAIALFPRPSNGAEPSRPRNPRELLDPSGRQLVLLLSDCVSLLWRQGKLHPLLKQWSSVEPTVIVQFLPERLWSRSALGLGLPVQLSAFMPGVANPQLEVADLPVWETVNLSTALTLPIVTLEPESLGQWAQMVGGMGKVQTVGMVFDLAFVEAQAQTGAIADHTHLVAGEILQRFRTTASPMARRLAGLMSLVPVSLPIVYLIQEAVLPSSRQVHVAEVMMSGLLEAQTTQTQSESVQYEFVAGVREQLQGSVPKTEALMVLDKISQYIGDRAGFSIRSFAALLVLTAKQGAAVGADVQQFAHLSAGVLRRFGGEYAAFVDEIDVAAASVAAQPSLPQLQTFEFEVATIAVTPETEPLPTIDWLLFQFESATLERQQRGILRNRTEWVIKRQQQQAYGFVEVLDSVKAVQLEMVQIPGGSFVMGAPKSEAGSSDDERPQHSVTITAFALGKYPVTQSQWRTIAVLPEVNRGLEPNPSDFKGDNRPVENVSWQDAVEFCDRLSQHTNKQYRLPSEAEWEYACRAGTTTPFHFGETITTDLANYRGTDNKEYKWSGYYGSGPKGVYRQETTDVGSFKVANNFGLYDLHGNVWEWCADHWHGNYDRAPTDGSAWLSDDQEASRLLRGGSWVDDPAHCRSAFRLNVLPGDRGHSVGFRVVCAFARTLS